ncbi:MAG: hypothetical protein MUP45_04870 [Candidatus Marinimicrobia bacterium]|nr:hypothetical protein [Candidatus Neomarinimicrobiota bacterium]
MSNKQKAKEKIKNCCSDLQRSAIAFYLNPKGKTHQIFLKHAKEILAGIKSQKAREFSIRISQMETETTHFPKNKKERINLADKILTLGCLLK